jgi:hypothetical protein
LCPFDVRASAATRNGWPMKAKSPLLAFISVH